MNVFDGDSDLSDIGSNDSPPATPGNAITPKTSPTHRARESSADLQIASSSSGRKVAGPSKYRVNDKKIKRKSEGLDRHADEEGKSKKKKQRMDEPKSIKERAGKEVQSPQALDVTPESDIASQPTTSTMTPVAKVVKPKGVKKTSMKGWAYIPEEEIKKPDEDVPIDGKRSRKPSSLYTAASSSAKRARDSASADASPSASTQVQPPVEESNGQLTNGAHKPKLKIRLHIDSKSKPQSAQASQPQDEPSPPSRDASAESDISDPPVAEDGEDAYEEEEDVQRPRKRQRDAGKIVAKVDNDDEEEEEDAGPVRIRPKHLKSSKKSKKEKREKKRSKAKTKLHDEVKSEDDFRDAKVSEDESMSDAADEEGFESDVKIGSRLDGKSTKAKAREDSTQTSNSSSNVGKKGEPRRSTGSAPSKNTVAGLINTFAKAPPAIASPKPAVVKAAVRKVPSMNLFDNIMGFGGGSKQSTPAKGAPTKIARSSLSGLSTPQSKSPIVKATTSALKKDGESASTDASSVTASRVSSLTGRASPMPNNGRSGRMVTVDVKGANGEHVTPAEMDKRKEVELYANAHPKGLFNLLEGAEIMMQFEDDTRRLLEFDPLIARTKLYRASRTEGLPKLIERIKEDERKKREARLGLTTIVNVEPITSN